MLKELEAKAHKIINGPPIANYWSVAILIYAGLTIFINVFPELSPDWLVYGFGVWM